jgi:hypothetical protein
MLKCPRVTRLAVLALLPAITACYTVQPITSPAPAAGSRIVAELTDAGTAMMAPWLGPGALEIEGLVESATEEEWRLALIRVDHRQRGVVSWNREEVVFPRSALSGVAVRTMNRKRSILAAVGITGGALLVARLVGLVTVGDGAPPGGGTPPQ